MRGNRRSYGEATIGSAQKIGLLLMNLRHLVLHDLHDSHWGLLFDLGPHSTFLDIGSGYGKVRVCVCPSSSALRRAGREPPRRVRVAGVRAPLTLPARRACCTARHSRAERARVGSTARITLIASRLRTL